MRRNLSLFFLSFLASSALVKMDAKALSLPDVPPAVRQTIKANSSGRTISAIARTEDGGEVSYEVTTMAAGGKTWDLVVAENGKLLSIDIPPTAAPPAVQAAIQRQMGQGTLAGIAKEFDEEEPIYEAGITAPNGAERDFTFAEDGTLIGEEVAPNDLPSAVQTAVNAYLGKGLLVDIEKEFDGPAPTYRVGITAPNDAERDFTFAEDGSLVSQEMRWAELPPAIQTAIKIQLRQAKLESIDKTFDNGEVSYEVTKILPSGQEHDFTISATGALTSQEMSLAEMPPVVRNTILRTIGDGKILRIDQQCDAPGVNPYHIEALKDGKPFNFIVGQKGKFRGMDN
ncbi:MAG TPA: PepSY-like domain-containing protein [Candidatus Methylacidiphilales bacterium]|nr:PepSY-like domain-containing protein [Candidatus Methylacidiphilales bacterium]